MSLSPPPLAPPPALERLRKRAQFLEVRKGAKTVRGCVLVEARRRAPAGAIGVGFTASSKVGGAVIRNRAKRRMREAARVLLPQHGLAGVDYVIVARQSIATASWAGLLDDLGNALIRLRADLDPDVATTPRRRRPPKAEPASTPTESE